MKEEKKLHEKKRMEGRRLNEAEIEAENEEDYKATLVYDLEKEIREIFEECSKKQKTKEMIYDCVTKILMVEVKYEKEGLSWEEIREIRKGIVKW